MERILIVDDENANLESLAPLLTKEKFQVFTASHGKEALEVLRTTEIDVALVDLVMPEINGIDLLKLIKKLHGEVEVIIMTAHGTIETAVESMKEGAYDFITKPFKRIDILKVLKKALEKKSLSTENKLLKSELAQFKATEKIIGASTEIEKAMDLVRQISSSSATILIEGASGTGKELVAEAIHNLSPRKDKKLVKLSCAALPETLLEAELFGYVKGAFTGALGTKDGRFALANGGTLFLDEVGEISQSTQVKLLRVLQNGEFEKLGSNSTEKVDVRIIAATNRDISALVKEGIFREDLYYRLNVIKIRLPLLQERTGDIPILVHHFIEKYSKKNNKAITGISQDALDVLSDYSWPGNVRELENTIERAIVLAKTQIIQKEDLPPELLLPDREVRKIVIPIGMELVSVENKLIAETLLFTKGDKKLAAKLLGITERTIYRKLKESDEL